MDRRGGNMSTILKGGAAEALLQGDQPAAPLVKETLRLILESHPFRTSKQCQDLLRYIVEHSLSGDSAALRERIIGAQVFHREPSYDTNGDPVVRVRAADVRKRLAQYYQSLEAGASTLHIELQPGSYRAHFTYNRPLQTDLPSVAAVPEVAGKELENVVPQIARKARWLHSRPRRLAVLALGVLIIAGAAAWIEATWTTPQERFWAPIVTAKQPVLIYLGANVAYLFSSDFLARYRAAHGIPDTGREFFVDLPPGSSVRAEDMLPVKDTFVTTGDVTTIVELTTLLRDWKRPFVLRTGNDLSFGDLRARPTMMVGAFNNSWTLELTNDLPYSFRQGIQIFNRDHPEQSWSVPRDARSSSGDDYALISRLLTSKTGGPAMTVAGIGEFGTLAAAEFLTSPEKMRDLLKTAPRGWENKNMQAVLKVKVVGYQPVAVQVVATKYW
jgi:hypothetical protein